MAGLPPAPPAPVPPPAFAAPPEHPFRDIFADASKDSYGGEYAGIYNTWSTTVTTPQDLRRTVYEAGNNGSLVQALLLVRPTGQVGDGPGTIVGFHGAARHVNNPVLGLPTYSVDNVGMFFLGDCQGSQSPTTVRMPDTYFNAAPSVQVPTVARMNQLPAADPNLQLVDPVLAGDPDTEEVTVRRLMWVPNSLFLQVLNGVLTPRQAWEQIQVLIAAGTAGEGLELLQDWLRAALTRRGTPTSQPTITVEPPTAPVLATPPEATAFQAYRRRVVLRHIPGLDNVPITGTGQAIVGQLQLLVQQQAENAANAEARRLQEREKMPSDTMSAIMLQRLMRWCQVMSEDQLPELYSTLARSRKSDGRATLEGAIAQTLSDLGYGGTFPVSQSLHRKLISLQWMAANTTNLSSGVSIFTMGPGGVEGIERQQDLNATADLVTGGGAQPSLSDAAKLIDTKGDLSFPKDTLDYRGRVKRFISTFRPALGSQHGVSINLVIYHSMLLRNEELLARIPGVSMLLALRLFLDFNCWLDDQAESNTPIPAPNFSKVFRQIKLSDQSWKPEIPPAYLQSTPLLNPPAHAPARGGTGGGGTPAGSGDAYGGSRGGNVIIRNPHYHAETFATYLAMGHTAKDVRQYNERVGVALPLKAGTEMCLAYHVKNMCNTNCPNRQSKLVVVT